MSELTTLGAGRALLRMCLWCVVARSFRFATSHMEQGFGQLHSESKNRHRDVK